MSGERGENAAMVEVRKEAGVNADLVFASTPTPSSCQDRLP